MTLYTVSAKLIASTYFGKKEDHKKEIVNATPESLHKNIIVLACHTIERKKGFNG
jgi:hypothetical protein